MQRILPFIVFTSLVGCGLSESPAPVEVAPVDRLEVTSAETLEDTDRPTVAEAEVFIEPVVEAPIAEAPPADAVDMGPPKRTYTLRRGETLAHFARWSELPVEEIASTSALDLDGMYAVGTEIALAISPEEAATLETRRDAHHQTRAENYLQSRGANGTEFYSVKTGDSAWSIARDRHGMPVWLLESLNPSASLDALRPGDNLLVPVFNDIVVEAPPSEEAPTVEAIEVPEIIEVLEIPEDIELDD